MPRHGHPPDLARCNASAQQLTQTSILPFGVLLSQPRLGRVVVGSTAATRRCIAQGFEQARQSADSVVHQSVSRLRSNYGPGKAAVNRLRKLRRLCAPVESIGKAIVQVDEIDV